MFRSLFSVVILLALTVIAVHCVGPFEQCTNQKFDDLQDRVQVIPCGAKHCKLRKGTNVTVIFKFRPKYEVKSLTNEVYATVANLPLPFVGVNGVSACAHVSRVADGAPAPCPLAADHEYTYTNVFFIESFYPNVPLRVHWGLNDGKRDVICFEVPAAIVAARKQ